MFRKIVTVTDGSERCLRAVETASRLAIRLGARLTILAGSELRANIAATDGYLAEADSGYMKKSARAREIENLDAAMLMARNLGMPEAFLRGEQCEESDLGAAIIRSADRLNADLIVIGSRGRHGLAKLLLGSTASEVLAGTNIPVLIVK